MDAQLKKQLSLTINVRSAASRNNYGDPTFGSASSMSARVENKTDIFETTTGMEERQSIVVITESEIKTTEIKKDGGIVDPILIQGDCHGGVYLRRLGTHLPLQDV